MVLLKQSCVDYRHNRRVVRHTDLCRIEVIPMINPAQKEDDQFEIMGPTGRPLRIPSAPRPEDGLRAGSPAATIRSVFEQQGYVVIRGLVPPERCETAVGAFCAEVKPSRRFFIRHKTGLPERHVFTEHGFMKYPIMNPHELEERNFGRFRAAVLDLFTDAAVIDVARAVLAGTPKLVHTMMFEGNQKTWVHRDAAYIDASEPGRLFGMWVALEDIAPGAGRFYVYPGSHRLDLPDHGLDPNSDTYVATLEHLLDSRSEGCVAPALARGDALLWSSRTIHGSLETRQPQLSRASLTAHYIRETDDLIWLKRRISRASVRPVHGTKVVFHANQDSPTTRYRLELIGRFPGPYKRVVAGARSLKKLLKANTAPPPH